MNYQATSAALLFLLSLAAGAPAADETRARELFGSLGCRGCHRLEGGGGTVGPTLEGIGKRMDREQIRQELVDPKADDPKSMMPSFAKLPPADLQALVDFLAGRK